MLMKRKTNLRRRATLLLLAMFCSLTATWAQTQSELTVYDSGTTTSPYVPAFIYYFDVFTRSQFVIPADDLDGMEDCVINAIKFYTRSDNVPYTTVSTVDVYLKEVGYTSISEFEAKADCSTVYQGTLDIVSASGGGELTITFATPFTYRGGNLLVGIENTTDEGFKTISFYGEAVSGASVSGYSGSSLDEVTADQQDFIPKTTLYYSPAPAQELTVYEGDNPYEGQQGAQPNQFIPASIHYFDQFTRSQFVIPAADLASLNGSSISTIKFYTKDDGNSVPYPGEGKTAAPVDVYLKEVSYSKMTTFDYEPRDGATTVYHGKLSVVPGDGCGIMTINLSTPYEYGGGNLLIGIDNTETASYQVVNFMGTEVTHFAAISGHAKSATLLNSNPGQSMYFIPQTTFVPTVIAPPAKPSNVEVTNLLANSASIYWDLPADATGSIYQYKKASDTEWGAAVSTESQSITIDGLQPATVYKFRVKTLRGSSASSWATVTFTTDCAAVTAFQWYENFEGYSTGDFDVLCWRNEHIAGPNTQLYRISGDNVGGNTGKKLYLPTMGGTDNKVMLVLPQMILGTNTNYMFSLDIYRSDTHPEKTGEGIRVYASADGNLEGATEMAFIPRVCTVDSSVIPAEQESGWYTYDLLIPMSGSCYIILVGESQNGRPVYLDNFRVDVAPDCMRPTGLRVTLTNGDGSFAGLFWQENGDADTWQVCLNGDESHLVTVHNTNNNYSSLTPETIYTAKVRAYCSATSQSAWSNEISFEPTNKQIIGSGSATNGSIPTQSNYNYSLTQQIYTADEVGVAGTIESIDFKSTSSTAVTRNLDIYMVSTEKSNFSGNSDWVAVSPSDRVYSGEVTFAAGAWTTITLDSPFEYNGNSNIAIIVDDNSGTWSGTSTTFFSAFSTSNQTPNQTLYKFSENTNYDPTNPSYSGERMSSKNQIRLAKGAAPAVLKPTGFAVSDITFESATLSWKENGTATQWQIGFVNNEGTITRVITADATPYTLTNLTPETTYRVKVRALKGGEESAWSGEVSFTTPEDNPVPSDIETYLSADGFYTEWSGTGESYKFRYRKASELSDPIFFDDFENGLDQWTVLQGEGSELPTGKTEGWYVYNPTSDFKAHSGSCVASSWSHALHADNYLISPKITFGNTLKFWVRTDAERPDAYEVLLSTTGNAIADFSVCKPLAKVPATGDWAEVTIDLSAYTGRTGYIAIHHVDYDGNYLLIDDFGIYNDAGPWWEWPTEETFVSMNGLATNTAYDFQVQSIRDGRWSWWSDMQTFALLTLQDDADNTSLIQKNAGRLAHVTLAGHTFKKDGKYNMMCLPFDLTLAGSPMADATIKGFASLDPYSIPTLTLYFSNLTSTTTVIPAGYPLIVMWEDGEDLTNPQFANVIMGGKPRITKAEDNIQFVGNFAPMTLNGDNQLYFGSDKPLSWPATNVNIGAFRAYLELLRDDVTQIIVVFYQDGTQISVSSILGDANGDGSVTITDAVSIVNYILGNASTGFNKAAANVNGDLDEKGEPNITITDAVGVVNIILNNGSSAGAPKMELEETDDVEAPEATEPE